MPHTRPWATARKARTLTAASASGCRALCRIHSVPFSMALGVLLLVISLLVGGIYVIWPRKQLNGWEYKSEGILRELYALAMFCCPGRVKVYATE